MQKHQARRAKFCVSGEITKSEFTLKPLWDSGLTLYLLRASVSTPMHWGQHGQLGLSRLLTLRIKTNLKDLLVLNSQMEKLRTVTTLRASGKTGLRNQRRSNKLGRIIFYIQLNQLLQWQHVIEHRNEKIVLSSR